MLVCKNAKAICDYRKAQKQWQFQPITLVLQVDDWGTKTFKLICETQKEIDVEERSHINAKYGARLAIGGSVWGDDKLVKLRMPRIDLLRRLGISPM